MSAETDRQSEAPAPSDVLSPHHDTAAATKSDRRVRMAYHEAGHAVVMRALGCKLKGATIVPFNDVCGAVWCENSDPKHFSGNAAMIQRADACAEVRELTPPLGEDREEAGFGRWMALATCEAIGCLAGPLAETEFGGVEPNARSHDMSNAINFARSVLYVDNALEAFLDYCKAETLGLLRQHWSAVIAVADLLLKCGTVDGEQIDKAVTNALAVHDQRAEIARRAAWRGTTTNAVAPAVNR